MKKYSIIIPIHNEVASIPNLLSALKIYLTKGHEVLIIDDGSTDGSNQTLIKYKKINLIRLKENKGKGYAIRQGLKKAKNNRVVIYDGDMELHPSDISRLMILSRKKNINLVMGYRFKKLNPLKSNFDWGNFMFTSFFNIIFQTHYKDVLCCAKSFYLDDINKKYLESNGFDIDVELSGILTIKNKKTSISNVFFNYRRRTLKEGKKLRISDGWLILFRIIKMIKYL